MDSDVIFEVITLGMLLLILGGIVKVLADFGDLVPSRQNTVILQEISSIKERLKEIDYNMARLVEVALELREAVTARFDREIAKHQEALAAKQAELEALIAAEDAEDVVQNADIARLQGEVAGKEEAIGILEEIKANVNSDLAGDGEIDLPDEPVAPDEPDEPVEEQPVVEGETAGEALQTQTADGTVVGDGVVEGGVANNA